jgi:putative membrane protein
VNALVRPIAFLMTLPLTIVTLGLFIFVLNAAMFGLVAAFLDNFTVTGFWSAVFGAIVVSITSTVASWYVGPKGRYEVFVVRRH